MASFVSHAVASKGGNRQKGERNANFDYTFFAASWPTYLPAVLSYDICSQPQPGGCQLRPKGSPESEIEGYEDVPELEALVEDSNTEAYTSHKGTNPRWKDRKVESGVHGVLRSRKAGAGTGRAKAHNERNTSRSGLKLREEWQGVWGSRHPKTPGGGLRGLEYGNGKVHRGPRGAAQPESGSGGGGRAKAHNERNMSRSGLKLREVSDGGWGMRMARCFGVHRVLRSREGGSSATPLKQLQKAKDDDDKQGHGMK
ncbi:hypothetical protein C8R43DRAFT_962113 [Mycena crocata]|nr:hypothetical protein C8R43DRAFT_962113 [Mycena crocata]